MPENPAMTAYADFAAARANMVDSQVRPNKVTDRRVIAALRDIPRERFLPPELAALAYADERVPLGGGRVMLEPMVLARLLQTAAQAAPGPSLVVAAGTGYGAAVLARLGGQVTALEEEAGLLAIARPALAAFAPEVSIVNGPLADGWAAGAPYRLILAEGAVEEVPPALCAQLASDGGRLLAVRRQGGMGQAVLLETFAGRIATSVLFDCATPLIPSLRAAPGFVF